MTERGPPPVHDGMTGITLMPFPFLNPWNWSVMSPGHALESAFTLARLNLDLWHSAMDAVHVSWRQQQEALLGAMSTEMARAREQKGAGDPFSVDSGVKSMAAAWLAMATAGAPQRRD